MFLLYSTNSSIQGSPIIRILGFELALFVQTFVMPSSLYLYKADCRYTLLVAKLLFVAPMFSDEGKGGPALRTSITLRALSRVFEVSVLLWSEKQLGPNGETRFHLEYPECKKVFIKDQKRDTLYLLGLNKVFKEKRNKLRTLLVLIEAKVFFGDSIRAWRQKREKAEFVKKIATQYGFRIIWWSFANLESSTVLLFSKKVSHIPIDIVADTDSVWSRFILRSLPFIPLHARFPVAFKGWKKELDEKKLISAAKVLTAVSEVDKRYYSKIADVNKKIEIVRNAIPIECYVPSVPNASSKITDSRRGVLLMGSFGRKYSPMDYGANWFIEGVWPKVRESVKDAELHIVGVGSKEFLQSDMNQAILVHGAVDSILPFVSNCRVSIVPLFFESGTRFKILEAAALGLVTVTTSLGNEGLEFEDKKELYVADNVESFATSVIRGLTDKSLQLITDRARGKLIQNYTFTSILNDIEQVKKQLNENKL